MTRPRSALIVGIALAAGVAAPAPAPAQQVVYLVRHAEKADTPADPPLTPAGVERSKALARLLKDADIRAIYVSDTVRSQQTAAPLAAARHLTPAVIPGGDAARTFDDIRAHHAKDAVLVVGHTNTLPDLIRRWEPTATVAIGEGEFDKIVIVVPSGPMKAGWTRFRYDAHDQ